MTGFITEMQAEKIFKACLRRVEKSDRKEDEIREVMTNIAKRLNADTIPRTVTGITRTADGQAYPEITPFPARQNTKW